MSSSTICSKSNTLAPSIVLNKLFKSLLISGLLIYVTNIFALSNSWLNHTSVRPRPRPRPPRPTNASHIVFGIAATAATWRNRTHYVEAWWRPNATRGYVFFDEMRGDLLLPWRNGTLPRLRISQATSKYSDYDRHKVRQAIRMARIVAEALDGRGGARWYVMADDDTVVFVDNLVDVLARYDHRKFMYVGANSETHGSNVMQAFDMAFGGAGYALSRPLAEAVAANLDVCLKRYPTLYGSDGIIQSCVADLGVSLTRETGFHQIDLHNDISGFLSAHARAPLVSLHHLDQADPIFPWMSRAESLNHLMTAAKADESRLLQQSVCYHKPSNWTFSVAWGYSVHVYESVVTPSALQRPLQTFVPWTRFGWPPFMFNTRRPSNNPCDAPHQFFLHSVSVRNGSGGAGGRDGYVVTSYRRGGWARASSPACSYTGDHSVNSLSTIVVHSPATKYEVIGNRRECCDVLHVMRGNVTEIKLRDCLENEIIP